MCEKIHQFLSSTKKIHTKENWLLFSGVLGRTVLTNHAGLIPFSADGVNLVDEHNGRRVLFCNSEQLTYQLWTISLHHTHTHTIYIFVTYRLLVGGVA